MTASAMPTITTITNAANERMRHALSVALGEVFRIDGRATVVAVNIESERPVLTLDHPIAIAGAHYITRRADGHRSEVWVAEEGGCRLECETPQPLPLAAGRRN